MGRYTSLNLYEVRWSRCADILQIAKSSNLPELGFIELKRGVRYLDDG